LTRTVGLTGGIGSGKSTVAAMFEALAVPVLDLDAVGRELLHDAHVQRQVLQIFGEHVLDRDGHIDRHKLGHEVFASSAQTKRLNQLLHPLIYAKERDWVQEHDAAPYVVIEASVLIESGNTGRMDRLLVLLAEERMRIARVLRRGCHDEATIANILTRQCADAERVQVADDVIDNSGSLEQLHGHVQRLHRQYTGAF